MRITSPALSRHEIVRKMSGVRESPIARMIDARKLNATMAPVPRKLICANTVAPGRSSAGVCSSARIGPANIGAKTVSTIVIAADSRAPVATERRTPAKSRAPNACAVGIANPLARPQVNPSSRNSSAPVAPTAASASTPRRRPTTMASTNWYSC